MWPPWVGEILIDQPPRAATQGRPYRRNLLPATPSQPSPPLPDGREGDGRGDRGEVPGGGRPHPGV